MLFWTGSDQMENIPAEVVRLCDREGIEEGAGPDDDIWFGDTG